MFILGLLAILWFAGVGILFLLDFSGMLTGGEGTIPPWLAILGIVLIIPVAIVLLFMLFALPEHYARLVFQRETESIHEELRQVHREQDSVEDTLKKELSDKAGLIELIRYSRLQLEAYYTVGLVQTRYGFRNSTIAMWLGFVLLFVGISWAIFPLERLMGITEQANKTSANVIILVSAAVIEFISAMFLWVYRSSMGQLTYFYDRQMYTHTALLCYQMADQMQQTTDETKQLIVASLLSHSPSPDRPAAPGSRIIEAFLTRSKTPGTNGGSGE